VSPEPDLSDLADALARHGARIGWRRISPGDEVAADVAIVRPERRRASGAARNVARRLLTELGAGAALARGSHGAPIWPAGFLGSLAHDEAFAVAVVAPAGPLVALGVDIEPAEPLPSDVVDLALYDDERRLAATPAGRLVFAAKEAVYKAIHPLDGSALEYSDIRVDLEAAQATLRDGRQLRLFTSASARLVAVAAWEGVLPG